MLDDMAETMYKAPGVGLAAPQIGENIRAIVVDVNFQEEEVNDLKELNACRKHMRDRGYGTAQRQLNDNVWGLWRTL